MEHAITANTHKVRYLDCISGKQGAPRDKKQKALFQCMLIFVAVPLTATINWLIHTDNYSWTTFSQHLIMLPLMFAIAIGVRFLIANPLVDTMVSAFVSPRLSCLKKALVVTTLNILVMGTVASLIRTIITSLGGEVVAWEDYLSSLPLSYLISFVIGYFVTTPLMKKFFAHTIEPHLENQSLRKHLSISRTIQAPAHKKPARILSLT